MNIFRFDSNIFLICAALCIFNIVMFILHFNFISFFMIIFLAVYCTILYRKMVKQIKDSRSIGDSVEEIKRELSKTMLPGFLKKHFLKKIN